jgi:hypothetical protein
LLGPEGKGTMVFELLGTVYPKCSITFHNTRISGDTAVRTLNLVQKDSIENELLFLNLKKCSSNIGEHNPQVFCKHSIL